MEEQKNQLDVKTETQGSSNRLILKMNAKKIKELEEKVRAVLDFLKIYDVLAIDYSIKQKGIMKVKLKNSSNNDEHIIIVNEMMIQRISSYSKYVIYQNLKFNQTLIKLNLGNNTVSDLDMIQLSEALMHNRSLTSIELKNNNLCLQGAKALSEVVKYNEVLVHLNLYGNLIPISGMEHLSKGISLSKTLKTLDMRNKEYSMKRIKPLLKSVRYCRSLVQFQFM